MTFTKTITSAIALMALVAPAALAGSDYKSKVSTVSTKARVHDVFKEADKNNDYHLNVEEYKEMALRDNEYADFLLIDSDNNKLISVREFNTYGAGKGFTTLRNESKRIWNTNRQAVMEKHYISVNPRGYR